MLKSPHEAQVLRWTSTMLVATSINFNLFICLKLETLIPPSGYYLCPARGKVPHIPECSNEFLSHEPPVCLPPYTVLDPGISMRGAPHSTMYLDVPLQALRDWSLSSEPAPPPPCLQYITERLPFPTIHLDVQPQVPWERRPRGVTIGLFLCHSFQPLSLWIALINQIEYFSSYKIHYLHNT